MLSPQMRRTEQQMRRLQMRSAHVPNVHVTVLCSSKITYVVTFIKRNQVT